MAQMYVYFFLSTSEYRLVCIDRCGIDRLRFRNLRGRQHSDDRRLETVSGFYARKQLLLSAGLSHRNSVRLSDFGLRDTFQERIAPKPIKIDMKKLWMKFSAFNEDFDGPTLDFLGSRKPAHKGIK